MNRHARRQPGPQALVELGPRVPIKTCFDGRRTSSGATELSKPVREANECAACEDARRVLHALDEPLMIWPICSMTASRLCSVSPYRLTSASYRSLYSFWSCATRALRAIRSFTALASMPSCDAKIVLLRLVQNPALLLQHRGITKPGHLSMAVK